MARTASVQARAESGMPTSRARASPTTRRPSTNRVSASPAHSRARTGTKGGHLRRRRRIRAALAVQDPREEELPASGPLRVADPETPGRELVIDTGSLRARALYRAAARVRRRALERRLRADGVDVLWLRTDRDPLPALVRFFHHHVGRVHGGV